MVDAVFADLPLSTPRGPPDEEEPDGVAEQLDDNCPFFWEGIPSFRPEEEASDDDELSDGDACAGRPRPALLG